MCFSVVGSALTHLQVKLEHNMLTGVIPTGLGSLPSLRVLWLAFNNLSGSLPSDLSRSSSLLSIDVRGNPRLCGTLPAGLHVNAVPSQWQGFCAKAYTEDSGKAQPSHSQSSAHIILPGCSVLTSDTGLGKPCAA